MNRALRRTDGELKKANGKRLPSTATARLGGGLGQRDPSTTTTRRPSFTTSVLCTNGVRVVVVTWRMGGKEGTNVVRVTDIRVGVIEATVVYTVRTFRRVLFTVEYYYYYFFFRTRAVKLK